MQQYLEPQIEKMFAFINMRNCRKLFITLFLPRNHRTYELNWRPRMKHFDRWICLIFIICSMLNLNITIKNPYHLLNIQRNKIFSKSNSMKHIPWLVYYFLSFYNWLSWGSYKLRTMNIKSRQWPSSLILNKDMTK